jgi:arginine decarboxylase
MDSSAVGDSAVPRQKRPVHAIITNSTYDGLCYNVKRVLEILGESIERIHFDEAWYGYARFNPLYKERYGMFEEVRGKKAPTIFTTTSTHKLLAALSQASFIHVRDGSKTIPHERFNESFMMHASTSPQYAIIASNEISAAMMDIGGENLTTESIREAVAFRQALRSINKDEAKKGNWFFDVWNADKIKIPDKPRADAVMGETDAKITPGYQEVDFEKADEEFLVKNASAWVLHPGDKWHGFDKLEDGYCMLDPIKVSLITPGIKPDGSLQDSGIPAMLVTAYLDNRGIVVEKTTDFTILFLFSLGITRGKWGTLINALLKFREDYNKNTPLIEVIPDKVNLDPDHYGSMGLKDLADEMFRDVKKLNLMGLQEKIYAQIPKQDLTPNQSYQQLVHGLAELLAIDDGDIADRTVATGIIPYPPGIPMLLSGENIGKDGGPHLTYLRALQTWDEKYQGFGHDIHGVVNDKGAFKIYCLNLKR